MLGFDGETVLIVEDDGGIALLQRCCLERAGYEVLTASTAEQALQLTAAGAVDLLVIDLRLPGETNGLELYAHIKASGADLPAIIVTGFSDEATIIRAFRAGVRDFVAKSTDYLEYLPLAVARTLKHVRMEQRLREQAMLLDRSKDAIYASDMQDRVVFWNASAEHLYGWSAAEAMGRVVYELLNCDPSEMERASEALLTRGDWTGELRLMSKDGSDLIVESRWSLVRDDTGRPMSKLIINSDISEQKSLEEQLTHAQRLDSIGALAGSVAHEINNVLQAITGHASFALESVQDPAACEDIRQIQLATERAGTLINQLLGFGRRHALSKANLDPNEAVKDLVKMLRPLIGVNIAMQMELAETVRAVHADPALLQQVLLNLCLNARDAMPSGGSLTIRTSSLVVDETSCAARSQLVPGNYVVISVSDTGCGMPPEIKERVFEPFFTTKEAGKGTGLGLSMVCGTIQQHNGHVEVWSEVEKGSRFDIYLPEVDARDDAIGIVAAAKTTGGSETILVADDETMVRDITARRLESSGYRVLKASNGAEALQLLEQHGNEIALALLDMVMPGKGGYEVYCDIRDRYREVAVIFCTGYDPHAGRISDLVDSSVAILRKPCDGAKLLAVVRHVLDSRMAIKVT